MSGPPPSDYDPRRLFPFGLSPIPELPSELASEVSSVYSYYEESEIGSEEEEEEEEEEEQVRSRISIMYSGSCSSVKSNRTLDNEESDDDEDGSDEEDEDTEVEDEKKVDENFETESEHYNSLVTHVMHQRAFALNETEEIEEQATEYIDEKDAEEAICVYENGPVTVENQVLLPEKENDFEQTSNQVEVSPGAATASEIFRHLQATHDKEEIRSELAKILNVLHTTLNEEESCSSSSNSGSDSESRSSTDEEQEPKTPINPISLPAQPPDPKLTVNVVKVQTAPLGKPPKYPSFKNRTIGPDIEERIRELSARKPGRSGKEEMAILSKILVTLLCSCRSTAATEELKKIIRHFKDAASEAGDEFGADDFESGSLRKRKKSRRRRRRWSSGATSSHGSEADSQTNTLTPCNTSSGTDDERENQPQNVRKGSDPLVSARLRFNVVVEDPPVSAINDPEPNVSFTISLPRRSSVEMSAEASYSSNYFHSVSCEDDVDKEKADEEEEEEEWEWEDDEDTGENTSDNNRQDCMDSMTTRKLLTDMECGAYNSDSLGSPSAGASGQSGEESKNDSPSAIESRPESCNGSATRKRSGRSREGSNSNNNNLFTHLEETFKVLNGAYKIITGSKPETIQDVGCEEAEKDSKKTFEEVLEGVSNECAHLENEIRKTSRPNSKMSNSSRKRAMSRNGDDDEDGWEYYYEEEEEEEESAPAAIVVTEAEVVSSAKPAQITKPEDHKQSRPSSRQTRSRPNSRTGSRPNSRLRTKTPLLGDVLEDEENGDWEWEYYYEEEECEELRRLSPTTTTAPTTRATSPFPPELPCLQRAHIVSPTTYWEEISINRSISFHPGEFGYARESIHNDPNVMCDSMLSVALAAEYFGQKADDLAATLPLHFMQDNEREEKRGRRKKEDREKKDKKRGRKFLPKVGVKELVNRLEPKLFQDVDTGTKMVMDQNIASSAIAKQKKKNSRNEVSQTQYQHEQLHQLQQQQQQQQNMISNKKPDHPTVIIHDTGNPNQVTVHQGGQATVVTMRRSGGGARTKEPTKSKQRSPSEGSEAYGSGSTTSVVEQQHMDEYEDESRGSSRHSRLFRLLQDSDYTDSESESKQEFGSGHRISLKGVEDLVATKETDMESLCSVERKHSFRSIRSSGKESDCDSITSSGRGIGEKSSSMQKEMAVKRLMTLNISQGRDFYASSSELSTPTSPTYTYAPDCPQLLSPERRRAQQQQQQQQQYRHSSAFEDSAAAPLVRGPASQLKVASRLSTSSPKTSSMRNSPKLELELMELAHLPSAPSFAMRNLHNSRSTKL